MIKLINNEDYRIFPLRTGKLLAHNEAYSYLLLLFKTDTCCSKPWRAKRDSARPP